MSNLACDNLMFVVERLYADAGIRGQSEIDSIIDGLGAAGHHPALRSMVAAAGKVATLGARKLGVETLVNQEPRFRAARGLTPIGDLLFTLSGKIADRCYVVQPFGDRLFVFEIRHHCVPRGLPTFCVALERAVRGRLDGRRVRGMNFNWLPFSEPAARQSGSPSRFPVTELKTQKPLYSDEELRAAKLLEQTVPRGLLLQLAKIGKVRATDAQLPPTLVGQLVERNLISKEYLVLCRKDSHTLCQVATIDDLNESAAGKLVCATCGRKFSEELAHEIFAEADLGKQLITSSRWMMIWLTELLVQAGLSKDEIAWSATAGDDEIDIMTDELGLRILFELKDREFGLGDAYPFAYRVERYGGQLGIVVTTDNVALEAEKFFQEQRSKSAASIETLAGDKIEAGVRSLVDKYSRMGVQRTVTNLAGPLGINIAPLIDNWMTMFAAAFRSGAYSPPEPVQPSPVVVPIAPTFTSTPTLDAFVAGTADT